MPSDRAVAFIRATNLALRACVPLRERAMRLPVFARIVATPSVWLPVAGVVRNTNMLLGRDGFVGVKTGSDHAAGGCFAFRAIRRIDGKRTTITGVVLGQPGDDRIVAGLAAADAMVDRLAGRSSYPSSKGFGAAGITTSWVSPSSPAERSRPR